MPEDDSDEELARKTFQFGGPDTEPVTVHGEDANIGDAIEAFEGLKEAQRTARLPGNEHFVEALAESLQAGQERLEKAIALAMLEGAIQAFAGALGRAEEEGGPELFEKSALFEKNEEGTFVAETDLGELMDEWKDEPPKFFSETAANFLEDTDPWEEWAEWAATHVMYWAAEDTNKELREQGKDPEAVSDEEWDRRFNDRLTVEEYFSDAIQILGAELASGVSDRLQAAVSEEELSFVDLEHLLDLHEADAPAPRESPNPFDMATGLASVPTGPVTRGNLMGISGEGEWREDSFDRPVYRYTIEGPPWGGNAQLSLKEAIEAETAWKMLREGKGDDRPAQFHADAVTLYLLFLAYASDQAPENRPGQDNRFRIPGDKAFRILNLPANWDRQKKVRHVHNLNSYLNSFQIQLKHVTYNGDRKRTEAISPAQLWDTFLRGVEESDLYGNTKQLDFWIEGREGAWADLFVHDSDTWTPWGSLPIRVLEGIDGRNKYTRLILFHALILFRVEKGIVKRTADHLLKWCRINPDELKRQTVYRRRRTILNALDELKNQGFEIDDERLRVKGTSFSDWQGLPVYFYPTDEIVEACPQIKAPEGRSTEPRSEIWTARRVRALRKHIGDTQSEFGGRLPNRKGGMGVKQPRVSTIENGPHNLTPRQEQKLDKLAEEFGFEG